MEYIEGHFYKEDKRVRKIALHYGFNHQAIKTIEELAELQQALSKTVLEKNKVKILSNLKEEIVDTLLMIEQLKVLLNLKDEELEKLREFKINRQLLRMKTENT